MPWADRSTGARLGVSTTQSQRRLINWVALASGALGLLLLGLLLFYPSPSTGLEHDPNSAEGGSGATSQSPATTGDTVRDEEHVLSGVDGCELGDAIVPIEGEQDRQYKDLEIPAQTTFDATTASWTAVSDYPIRLSGGSGVCWHGGIVAGTYPDTDSWDRMHDTAAFTATLPRFVGSGIRVHNYGDAINIVDNAEDFVLRQLHLTYIRDDCIENDRLHAGVVEDSFLDGCYTALSARPNPSDSESDGEGDVWVIRRSLIRLEPMPTVYKGTAPGHGRFFKWDNDDRGPEIELHDNVFRADQPPNDGDLGLPEGYLGSCSGNVMVWLGDGAFPGTLPECFTITTDAAVWERAVEAWTTEFGRYD